MNWIAERLEYRLAKNPEHTVIFDELTPKGLTYQRLYELSGRVYAYLSEHGVGKEDFVLINLARGVQPIIAIMGVWRAGAAFALVEDTYAPERIDFIRRDCNCKLELNAETWEAMMKCEPTSGYRDVAEHDAAYAIYTSGTTGNPKGVLHEYGNLKEAADSLTPTGQTVIPQDERFALAAPLNFVASIMVVINVFNLESAKLFILSYATVKNPIKLGLFMLEKRISCTFLTPSYVRALGGKTGPFLKRLIVGSEPANGIDPGNLVVLNVYAMSESGYAVGVFRIDKAYDTCPIGKPLFARRILLLDESGKEVPSGEIGEFCFENPYVRGYMNLPEETAHAFQNGIYHSGDLAKRLPNGDYVLLGRNTDMVKINGNRVEPAEVEAAVKQVLNLEWCAVRGFEDDEQAFLAAYYTADIPKVDTVKTREALSRRLPYYMLPQYFVKIDKVPLKPNGKMDRKALPKPDTSDYVSDYVAPTNPTEQALCQAMATALRLKRIGIHDDFYELGGDSLASMQVITLSRLPGLNASDIFRGRTPEKIAALYLEGNAHHNAEKFDERNQKALTVAHPLTVEQNYMVDYQLYTPLSTMYNLFSMIKIEKGILEVNELAVVITKVLKAHPVFATMLSFNGDGEIVQSYHPEIIEDVRVESLSEFDFNQLKDDLVKPYKIIGSRLYRCRLFSTEKANYLFFDVHHTIFDGTSFKVLMGDIAKACMGEELPTDYYYLILSRRSEMENSPFYNESRHYFESTYDGDDWVTKLTPDHDARDNRLGELEAEVGLGSEELRGVERSLKLSRNEFFLTAYLMAIALTERKRNIQLSWIHNGRDDLQAMSTCGLLFRDLPVALRFRDDQDVRDSYASVREQVRKAIEHSVYPYNEKNARVVDDDLACFLYQSDIRDGGETGSLFEQVEIRQNNAASQTVLDTELLDGNSGPKIVIHYAASRYESATIERFRDIFVKVCRRLAEHTDQTAFTFGMLKESVLGKPSLWVRILRAVLSREDF